MNGITSAGKSTRRRRRGEVESMEFVFTPTLSDLVSLPQIVISDLVID